MITEKEVVAKEYGCRGVSWSAIIAGSFLALALEIVLSLLGTSIGLGAINPNKGMGNIGAIGMGTALWWFITGLVSLFFGGMVSARFSTARTKAEGGVQGLLMWALATVSSLLIITTTLGILIGGGIGLIGQGISATGQAAYKAIYAGGQAAWQRPDINKNITDMLGLEIPDTQEAGEKAGEYKQVAEAGTDFLKNPQDQSKKENLINALTQSGVSREEAEDKVNKLIQSYNMIKQKASDAKQAAEKAAVGASQALAKAALVGFFTLLLGAIAAYWGGTIGIPLYDEHLKRTV